MQKIAAFLLYTRTISLFFRTGNWWATLPSTYIERIIKVFLILGTVSLPCTEKQCFLDKENSASLYHCIITQPRNRKSAAGLLPCSHQADMRMRSHRLLPLDDDKSAASCQQA